VVGCRILLPSEVYEAPPRGTLAVHDSYLPEYRGFAPLNWSIINGEDHTGVTLFHLGEGVDEGDIVARKKVRIGKDETAGEVYERVIDETIEMVLATWPLLEKKKTKRMKQDPNKGSITCSRTPVDGCIDWTRPTRQVHDLVRALTKPYPGAFTFHAGKKLFIWAAKPAPRGAKYIGRIPGRVVAVSSEGHIDVLTGDGVLRVTEVQEEGGESLPAAQVVKSVKVSLGVSVASLWDEVQRLRQQLEKKEKP
jgi:methionyl-tRNA formyltransferase